MVIEFRKWSKKDLWNFVMKRIIMREIADHEKKSLNVGFDLGVVSSSLKSAS